MIDFTIQYEQSCSAEELKSVQDMIVQGVAYEKLLDTIDFPIIEEAYIELAKQYGWDADKYIEEVLNEKANMVLSFDGEVSESLSKMMGNTAMAYVECYLNDEEFDDSYTGKMPYGWY